jgi:hypothetical protein
MVTLAAAAVVVLPPVAGAVTPPQTGELLQPGGGGGSQLPTNPIPTISDQTKVEVVVPATGSPFTAGQKLNIFECADADGQTDDLPTDGTACDGLTLNVGPSIIAGTGGTVDENNYEVYQLPSAALFESANGSPACSATSACVLYIGQNVTDFTAPFVFSQPFYVGTDLGSPTPESQAVIALPVVGILVVGGALFIRSRRRRVASSQVG